MTVLSSLVAVSLLVTLSEASLIRTALDPSLILLEDVSFLLFGFLLVLVLLVVPVASVNKDFDEYQPDLLDPIVRGDMLSSCCSLLVSA